MKNHPSVYYWRSKQEVDFVVLDPRLEVKLTLYNVFYTDELHDREVKGLAKGLEEFNLDRGVILTKNYRIYTSLGMVNFERRGIF